jgi:hypothetical protein
LDLRAAIPTRAMLCNAAIYIDQPMLHNTAIVTDQLLCYRAIDPPVTPRRKGARLEGRGHSTEQSDALHYRICHTPVGVEYALGPVTTRPTVDPAITCRI